MTEERHGMPKSGVGGAKLSAESDLRDETVKETERTDLVDARPLTPWARLRGWTKISIPRHVRWSLATLAVVIAVTTVATFTVDLGPMFRAKAAASASEYLNRDVTMRRIGAYLLPGRFLVEDLVIGGLNPGDRPFLTAERIVVSSSWGALLHGEILIDAANMSDWQMLVESFPDGRMSFPAFTRRSSDEGVVETDVTAASVDDEGRRIVTTLQFVEASRGEFRYEDHGSNWSVVGPNLEVRISKIHDYRGHASFSGGTIQIGDFEPMGVDMDTDFELEGSKIHLTQINLAADGANTMLEGDIDLLDWPEMFYRLESDIDFTRMREIFFAGDDFTASGGGHFVGTFHFFDGGHDLQGSFDSPVGGINQFRFPALDGQLLWQRDRFEVWNVVSAPYGGTARFNLSMAPLGAERPGKAIFEVGYENVDLTRLGQAVELRGIQPVSLASGHNTLQWPIGQFHEFRDTGAISLDPPDDVQLANAGFSPGIAASVADRVEDPPDLTTSEFAVGGEVDYIVDDGWIDLMSGRIATPSTHITFDGRTRFGSETRIPFQVTSTNWQESDRLMAGVMTALGAQTKVFAVDGFGTLDGVMLDDLRNPRIEATFTGENIRAWNVDWGSGHGEIVVEDSYLGITDGRFRHDAAELHVGGRFSLSGRRDDGGEELNAVFRLVSFPSTTIRGAFGLDEGYEIDGPATGELHLYGAYRQIFGFGRLTLDHPLAYGEPFDSATAGLRFEGNGVRLDGLEMEKGEGLVTGAAFIEWDASYSFNWDARNIGVETLELIPEPPEPLSGTLEFNASGVGSFDDPRYEVRGTVVDLFIGTEEVGQVSGRMDVRDGALALDLEGASSTIAVSASGRVALTSLNDADLSVRVANASLDPYVRMFVPELSPYTTAVVSGSMRVVGELRNWDHLNAEATIDQVALSIFDHDVRNDGPIRLSLGQRVVSIEQLRLTGDGTELELSGLFDLKADEVAIGVDGDANLEVLQGFFQGLRGSGAAVVRAEIGGSLGEPVLTGQAAVSNGRIRHFSLPHGLEAINGRVIFEPGGIRFDDVPAMMGGGPVTVGGYVGLTGFRPGELGITVAGQQMQLRYPPGFRSLIDTELVLGGDVSTPVLAGTVNVRDAVLLDGLDIDTGLFGVGGEDQPVLPSVSEEPVLPLSFDIRIVAPSSLRMTQDNTRIVSSAELTLRGTYDQPLLFGTAEIERGEAFIDGNRYRFNYGTIGFTNPTEIEPFIDVELETDVRVPGQTYRVLVRATGTLDRLVPTLSSDPPLPEVDILSLLLGDIRDPQNADLRAARAPELAQQQRFQAGAARLLTSPISSGVGRLVEKSFGVDTFQITPSLGDPSSQQSAQLNPTARILIGKRISGRAHLTLSRALSGANRDLIVVLEYDQGDQLSWILSQNEDRTYALDFRVRHSF